MALNTPRDLREFSVRDLAYVLCRHKRKAFVLFVIIMVQGVLATLRAPEIYESEAKLMVRLGRETVTLDPTATTGRTLHVSRSLTNEINSELEILKSRELVEQIVDTVGPAAILNLPKEEEEEAERKASMQVDPILKRLGLSRATSPRDSAIVKVTEALDVRVQKNTNIIQLGINLHSPDLAQRVLDMLIEIYLEKHIEVHQTPGSYDFFAEQTAHFRTKLEAAEEQLKELRNETGIVSFSKQSEMNLERIGELLTAIDETEIQIAFARAKAQELRDRLRGLPDTVILQEATGLPNTALENLLGRTYELRLLEKDLAAKYVEGSPPLKGVRDQIVEAEELLESQDPDRSETIRGPNADKQQLSSLAMSEEMQVESLTARLQAQREQLDRARETRELLDREEFRMTRLQQDIERDQENYDKYVDNLEQARIYDALETSKISNIGILQAASHSSIPIGPRPLRNLALAIFAGLFGAFALALTAEFLDQSIKTREDAENRLHLQPLASIPKTSHPIARAPRRTLRREIDSLDGDDGGWTLSPTIRVPYENLRTHVLHPGGDDGGPIQVIGVTSAYGSAGVTSVTANLGVSAASADEGEILILDAHFADPRLHSIFKSELSPGLVDLLATRQRDPRTIQPSPVRRLDVLSAGISSAPRRVDDMEELEALLEVLKRKYAVILVDLPPARENAYATRLAALCDATILVVEAEKHRWQPVERTKKDLENAGANLLGVVLNKRRYPIPAWLYRML